MENHLNKHLKPQLNPEVFKEVRNKIIVINRRFKQKAKSLNFSRKNYFNSFCKHYIFLEKLLIRVISQLYKKAKSTPIDPTDYEEVMKKSKADKKFSKKLLFLEEELKSIRFKKESLENSFKQVLLQKDENRKKQELHLKMQEKAKARQEDLKNIQKFLSKSPNQSPPRYLKVEQEFNSAFRQAEFDRIKFGLKHKSEVMKSVSIDEIRDHARHYNELILDAKSKRKARLAEFSLEQMSSPKNIFKISQTEEREEMINVKKNMLAKRKNYSEIVKEIYVTKIKIGKLSPEKNPDLKKSEKGKNSDFFIERKRLKKKIIAQALMPNEHDKLNKKNLSELRLEKGDSLIHNKSLDVYNLSQGSSERVSGFKGKDGKDLEKLNGFFKVQNEIRANQRLLESVKSKMKYLDKVN